MGAQKKINALVKNWFAQMILMPKNQTIAEKKSICSKKIDLL